MTVITLVGAAVPLGVVQKAWLYRSLHFLVDKGRHIHAR